MAKFANIIVSRACSRRYDGTIEGVNFRKVNNIALIITKSKRITSIFIKLLPFLFKTCAMY